LSVKTQVKQQRRARRKSRGDRFGQAPRIEVVADDATLTPFGGSAVLGELVRRLELIPALDRAIETAPTVGGLRPVKQRARGCSAGQLLVAVAESQLCGGDSMLDLERLRADQAGAELRAVAGVPAASTACQLARRYRRSHLRAAEAAFAACTNSVDAQLGRASEGPVTLDFDSTGVEVYGRNKPGAGVNYQGPAGLPAAVVLVGAARAAVGERAVGRQRLHQRRGAAADAAARAGLSARRPRPGGRAL
jgi:hypothetical protein